MRLLCLTIGDRDCASSRLRVYQYESALGENGFHVSIRPPQPVPKGFLRPLHKEREESRCLAEAAKADIVLIQKRLFSVGFIRKLFGLGKPVVFDFDDAIYTSSNGEYSCLTKRRVMRRLEAVLQAASLVLAGNSNLDAFARKYSSTVEVVPTTVDLDLYRQKTHTTTDICTLGWIGSHSTQAYLDLIDKPIIEFAKRFDHCRLVVVSNVPYDLSGVDVEFRQWSRQRELKDLASFDIGLMPLEDTEWSRGKCAFKAIQYLASGVPAVASPVGMAKDVVVDGETGYLCKNDEEWVEALVALARDAERRNLFGSKGRARVEEHFSRQQVGAELANLLQKTLSHRGKSLPATY